MGVRAAGMPLDGSRTVLIGYGEEALWNERLLLHDVGDGSWVVLTLDEDMFVEDLSRADSLRICGPNRELPRGIGNGQSYRFGGAWYTPDELEVLREEARLLAMVKPAGAADSEGQGVTRRRVPAGGGVLVPDEPVEPVGMLVDDSERNIGRGRTPPRREDGSEWVIISGGEFFGRTVKAGSIRVELEDLALADLGLQVVTCQRMKKDLVEGMLESLCDTWRETLGRRQQRDMGRILSDSLGAAPVLGGEGGLSESDARVLPVQRDEMTQERWRDWKSLAGMIGEPLFPDWPLEGPRTTKWLVKEIAKSGEGPLQHHQRWKTHLRTDDGDRSVHEHELLCMTLEISGCYDQLDLSALAGMELVSRRLQLIEKSKAAGGAAAYEGAKFFVGYQKTKTLVAPELGRHVAHKLQEEVSVMKERRKHAEERGLARGPPAKGGKTT